MNEYIWPADRTLEDFGEDDIANSKFSNQEFDAIRSWVESSGAVSIIKADITVLSKCCSWRVTVTDLCRMAGKIGTRPCIIINAPLETINTTPGPASWTMNILFLFFSFLFFFGRLILKESSHWHEALRRHAIPTSFHWVTFAQIFLFTRPSEIVDFFQRSCHFIISILTIIYYLGLRLIYSSKFHNTGFDYKLVEYIYTT